MTTPITGRPEDRARAEIDRLLTAANWLIQNRKDADISAAPGVVEAKKAGPPLIGVEIQTSKYSEGLLPICPPIAARCHSAMKAPESKLASPISSSPSPAAGRSLRFIVPKLPLPGLTTSIRCWACRPGSSTPKASKRTCFSSIARRLARQLGPTSSGSMISAQISTPL